MIAFAASVLPRFVPSARVALLVALGLVAARPAAAQREVRHLNAISLTYGRTSTGTPSGTYFGPSYSQLTYGRFIKDGNRFEAALAVEDGTSQEGFGGESLPHFRAYELGIGIAPTLLHLGEIFYLRLPMQLRTRYERLPPVGEIRHEALKVGPAFGLAAEVYLHDRISITGEARQTWYPFGHPLDHTPYFVGAGLSLHLGQ